MWSRESFDLFASPMPRHELPFPMAPNKPFLSVFLEIMTSIVQVVRFHTHGGAHISSGFKPNPSLGIVLFCL